MKRERPESGFNQSSSTAGRVASRSLVTAQSDHLVLALFRIIRDRLDIRFWEGQGVNKAVVDAMNDNGETPSKFDSRRSTEACEE